MTFIVLGLCVVVAVVWAVVSLKKLARKQKLETQAKHALGIAGFEATPEFTSRIEQLSVPPFGVGFQRELSSLSYARPRGQNAWLGWYNATGDDVVGVDLSRPLPWLWVGTGPVRTGVCGRQLPGPAGLVVRGDDERFAAAVLELINPLLSPLGMTGAGVIDLSIDRDALVALSGPPITDQLRFAAWLDQLAVIASALGGPQLAHFEAGPAVPYPIHGHPGWCGRTDLRLSSVIPWRRADRSFHGEHQAIEGHGPAPFWAFVEEEKHLYEVVRDDLSREIVRRGGDARYGQHTTLESTGVSIRRQVVTVQLRASAPDLGTMAATPGEPLAYPVGGRALRVRTTAPQFAHDIVDAPGMVELLAVMPDFWIHGDRLWLVHEEKYHRTVVASLQSADVEHFAPMAAQASRFVELVPEQVWRRLGAR